MWVALAGDNPTQRTSSPSYGLRVGSLLVPWLPAVLVLLGAGLVTASPMAGDSWLALTGGREVLQHGLPSINTLSTLGHGRAWIDQAWVGQIVFYAAYALGGLSAVTLLGRLAVTVAELVALGTAGRRRSSPIAMTIALVIAFSLLAGRSEIRPQLLAEPLFALLLWVLVDEVRRPTARVLWAAPLILVVWANVHGSVLLGSALLLLAVAFAACGMVGSRSRSGARRVGWLAFVAVAAPFASPYGSDLLDYYRSVLSNDAFARYLSEWQRSTPTTAPFACVACVAVVVLVVAWWRRTHLFDAVVLVALATGTLLAQRDAVWLALAIIALLPPLLDGLIGSRWQIREIRGAATLCLAAAVIATVMLGRLATTPDATLAADFPHSAASVVAAADRDPQADVLATPGLSDWLLFQAPTLAGRIVADGRFEVLSGDQFVRLIEVDSGARSASTSFPRARILAADPASGLARRGLRLPGARQLERDGDMVVIGLHAR